MVYLINKIDKNIYNLALLYLTIPLYIFLFGFLKLYISIPITILLIVCSYSFFVNENSVKIYRGKAHYYIICAVVLFFWLRYSGIGSFSFQNPDYEVRNAVFNDLVNYKWPLYYSFDGVDDSLLYEYGLTNGAGFVYYFTYWLPAALFGKIFGQNLANVFLFMWSFVGLCLVIRLINNKIGRQSISVLVLLICFSGLDYIYYYGQLQFIDPSHIEWWAELMQYSSNTTGLYWVFNQIIPCWIIVSLLLNLNKASSILFVSSLIFIYSPFITFGLIPIAVYLYIKSIIFKNRFSIKEILTPEILWVILELCVFGSYYSSVDSTISVRGLIWKTNGISFGEFFTLYYIPFIVIEISLYIILLYKRYKNDMLFVLIVVELLAIPFYRMTPANDFSMRASAAPLFLLAIYAMEYFAIEFEQGFVDGIAKWHIKKKLLMFVFSFFFIVSLGTPIKEIYRSVMKTSSLTKDQYTANKEIKSIGNPITMSGFELCNEQFYAKDLENQVFFKYLAKQKD